MSRISVGDAKDFAPSMLAAGKQGGENTQIRIRKEPAFRLPSYGSSGAHDGTEMFTTGDAAKVLDADSCQVGNFVLCKNLLSGFNSDHPQLSSANNFDD
jgi:hypothetical protein